MEASFNANVLVLLKLDCKIFQKLAHYLNNVYHIIVQTQHTKRPLLAPMYSLNSVESRLNSFAIHRHKLSTCKDLLRLQCISSNRKLLRHDGSIVHKL